MTITELVQQAYAMAVNKGFHDAKAPNLDQKLLLVVSELAEAQDELRQGHQPWEVYTRRPEFNNARLIWSIGGVDPTYEKPEGFGIELADALIRIADLAGMLGLDLEGLVKLKMAYNATRPAKHGKQF